LPTNDYTTIPWQIKTPDDYFIKLHKKTCMDNLC